jgi:hypothetical protein
MSDISNIFPRQQSPTTNLAPAIARMAMPWDQPHTRAVAVVAMPKLTSGYGQFHTNDFDPKKPEKRLTPYASIDLAGIRAKVDNPQIVDKTKAQWLIPSTLPSRTFAKQEQDGEFWMLWADLDADPKPISEVGSILRQTIIPGNDFELYASKSAREDFQKARIIIPLTKPLSGADWMLCQELLGDKLAAAGIAPDRAAERPGQLCYLPNRGAYYEARSAREGVCLDPMTAWAGEIATKRQALEDAAAALQREAKAAAERREALMLTDSPDTIGAFNRAYTVQDILQRAGYGQRGDTFRHPNSESGSYSASVKNGRVHSLSSSDLLYTSGGGVGAHDAFSAFAVLWAGDDMTTALKLAGDEWLAIDGESWNKVQQREYAKKQAGEVVEIAAEQPQEGAEIGKAIRPIPHISEVSVWKSDATVEQPPALDEFPTEPLNRTLEWLGQSAEDTNHVLNVSSVIHLAACTAARCVVSNKSNTSALYLCQIARTGEGKNAGKNAVGRCMSQAVKQMPISSFSSASGIFSALRHSPSTVFHLDEFGDKLRHGLNDKGGMISAGFSFLKEVFSQTLDPLLPKAFAETGMSSRQREQFRKDNGPIQHPHLNLLAVTTPGQFHDAVTDAMVEGGMLNRFVAVEAGSMVIENVDFNSSPPEWLILHIQAIRNFCGGSGSDGNLADLMQHDPDHVPHMQKYDFCDQSMALLNAFKDEIKQLSRHDEFYADMTRRWRENAMRMALALHVFSDHQNPTINVEITQWCIDYVRHHGKHFIKKLYELAAPSEKYGQRRKAYLAAFRGKPVGVSSHVMGKYAPWRDDHPKLRQQIIEDMLTSGDIAIVLGDKPARGPAPKLYVAVA